MCQGSRRPRPSLRVQGPQSRGDEEGAQGRRRSPLACHDRIICWMEVTISRITDLLMLNFNDAEIEPMAADPEAAVRIKRLTTDSDF